VRNRRGFTLIEMSAIIAIVTLFAALATPSFLARQRTREVTAFFVRLPDLAVYAREVAQRDERTVRVRFDEGQNLFIADIDGEVDETGVENEPSTVRQVPMPPDVRTTNFRQEENSVNAGEWELTFYPDGRSDGGAVELDDNGRIRSMVVAPDGTVRLQEGAMPTIDERRWPAGDREQRL
jgi:prepilin-type N-terminal cleavage/methylation domain-containing protein